MKLKGEEIDYYNKYVSKECQKWAGSGIFTMNEVKILRSVYKKWVKTHAYDVYGSVDLLENIPEIQFLNKAFKTSKKINKVFIDFDNHQYKIVEEI